MFEDEVRALSLVDGTELDDAARVEALAGLERVKSAAAAAQARITCAFETSQRAGAAGRRASDQLRRSAAAQVALARRDSPVAGNRHVGVATALVHEMPHTLAALTAGEISEWRATIMVRETATLSRTDRTRVDRELAGSLGSMGNRQVAAEARAIGYRLDPTSLLRRTRGAESDRRVSLRPAPDTMTLLTGFLPVAQGVAVHASLRRHAEAMRSQGDPRSVGQLMADTLVSRVTGLERPDAVPVEIQLVMPASTLLEGGDIAGRIAGYGPIPASVARRLVREADKAWLRRLYARPSTGQLVALESRRREFDGSLRRFIVVRDDVCRTLWCDAPVKHADHPDRAADGGATSAANGQGLCEACNYVKESPGWSATARGPTISTTTPAGHHYHSRPPPLPGGKSRWDGIHLEIAWAS